MMIKYPTKPRSLLGGGPAPSKHTSAQPGRDTNHAGLDLSHRLSIFIAVCRTLKADS